MKVAALGRTTWLYDAVEMVVARGHEVTAVATRPAAPEYRVREDDFRALAKRVGAAFVETPAEAAAAGAEIAVSVNWPHLITGEELGFFRHGVINAHAGDLPRYRGNAAPNWAIIAGEPRVVATVHFMDEGLDSGPILLQRAFSLTDDTYIGDVYRFLDGAFPELLADAVTGVAERTLTPQPQSPDPAASLRCLPRRPEDAELRWSRAASELARVVRASAEPFAGAFSFVDGEPVIIWRARAEKVVGPLLGVYGQIFERRPFSGEVAVLTGDGALVLEEVEMYGARTAAAELLGSTRLRFGARRA